MPDDNDPLWNEFLAIVEAARLPIPAERLPIMFASFRLVRGWAAMIAARPKTAADEPANAYSVASVLRVVADRR
jgi:hypothetical protein